MGSHMNFYTKSERKSKNRTSEIKNQKVKRKKFKRKDVNDVNLTNTMISGASVVL